MASPMEEPAQASNFNTKIKIGQKDYAAADERDSEYGWGDAGNYRDEDGEDDETGLGLEGYTQRGKSRVRAQPKVCGTVVQLTSKDYESNIPSVATVAAAAPATVAGTKSAAHRHATSFSQLDHMMSTANIPHPQGSPSHRQHTTREGASVGEDDNRSWSTMGSTWTPAAHPDLPAAYARHRSNARYTGERPLRTVPNDVNQWFLFQLGYAMNWARACAKRRTERIGSRELATVPCFEWCVDLDASRKTCTNAAACLAAGLEEWEPLPQEFVNIRAKALSDVSALTKRTDLFMRDVAMHGHGQHRAAAKRVCEVMKDMMDKNKDCLRTRREMTRQIGALHVDTLTTILSNNDWICADLHERLQEISTFYESTKGDITVEFQQPSTELQMRSRGIRRATDDLRNDVRESGVLSNATMSALDAVAETSHDGINMDQISYMRRELMLERDRLTRQKYTLGDEHRDHEEMQSRLHTQFEDMNGNLETLHRRRAELAQSKEDTTDAQEMVRIEMDMRRIERQIGEQGAQMAENMRLSQWTREESTSRVDKQSLVTQWLDRLSDLQKVLDEAAKVQNATASRHHEYMSVLDGEVQKTLTTLKTEVENKEKDIADRVVRQLASQIDAMPADVQESQLVALARRNAVDAKLAVSRMAAENTSLRSFKNDVDKLYSIAAELLEAQTLAAKMINFEEILTTLKKIWALVWAHDKKA